MPDVANRIVFLYTWMWIGCVMMRRLCFLMVVYMMIFAVECKLPHHLREASDMTLLPDNTPTERFFKYSFARLDEGDIKSLAIVMKDAYATLCTALYGCHRAEEELDAMYQLRFNELEINSSKMRKLGFLLQRLASGASKG
jgi:hypothetical protein